MDTKEDKTIEGTDYILVAISVTIRIVLIHCCPCTPDTDLLNRVYVGLSFSADFQEVCTRK